METSVFVEQPNVHPTRQEEPPKPKRRWRFRLNIDKQRCGMFVLIILIALTLPIIMYFITINVTVKQDINYSCAVDDLYRIPCGRMNISKEKCLQIQGCYDDYKFSCYHFMPSKYNYHINENQDNFDSLQPETPLGNVSLPQLKLSVLEIDSNKVKIMLHSPSLSYSSTLVQNKTYLVKHDVSILGVEVFRQSTDQMILTTLLGPAIASEHYWEWTVHLINDHLIGLGELKFPINNTLTKVIYKSRNDHTTLPNFMSYLNGSFYGVLIEHDGPLEVTVLPSKILILRSLAGDRIGFTLHTGPTLKDVMQQMRKDNSPISMPYWTLGAHICRDGSTTIDNALKEFIEFYEEQQDIHYISDCIHENLYNIMYQANDEHNIPQLIQSLQQNGIKFLMSIPPQIVKANKRLYEKAVELNILYKNASGQIFHGVYQNHEAAFPDYAHASIETWFEEMKLNLPTNNTDGFVLKDNWPDEDNYIFKDSDYVFPYMTDNLNQSLSKTIFWNATSPGNFSEPHILRHNLYGNSQISAFKNFTQYQLVLTSSFDSGYSNPILVQNINISWTNLKKAVSTTLYNGIFGNFLTSYPICGSTNVYNTATNDELCLRWYITAATLPLFRISSDLPRRDPSNLFSGFTKNVVQDAIRKRYMLLPYYYSTLSGGNPLARPMFYNFHNDNVTWTLKDQYMLGDALLVAQSFLPAITQLKIYLPKDVNTWYEFWGGNPYNEKGWIDFNVVTNDWTMFISEGYIIPLRYHKNSQIGKFGPDDSFGFAVALNCTTPECFAKGILQLDSAQLSFVANNTGILISNVLEAKNDIGCDVPMPNHPKYIENLLIYGIENYMIKSNFTTVDLCTVNVSELYISYFV